MAFCESAWPAYAAVVNQTAINYTTFEKCSLPALSAAQIQSGFVTRDELQKAIDSLVETGVLKIKPQSAK